MFDQGTSDAPREKLPVLPCTGAASGGSAVGRVEYAVRPKYCLTHYSLELFIEILQRMNHYIPADHNR